MFDKNKFAQILKNITDTYESQREFSKKSGINRTYLSQYMNMKLDKPPKPYILNKLANASNGIITYTQLMIICGYYQEPSKDIENYIYTIFQEISNYSTNYSIVKSLLNSFISYQNDLIDSFLYKDKKRVLKVSYYTESSRISMPYFMILHDSLIKYLVNNNIIYINNASLLIDWHNDAEVCNYLDTFSLPILFSYDSKYFKLYEKIENQQIVDIIKQYGISLNYLFSLYCSNNSNINIFDNHTQYYMCPVYGRISAGQPNWVEECIEGRLPIDPNLMNIVDPEECYFLRVNGESMNKLISNGAYALIRKTDWVENGEVAVVLVNGFDATLKKFSKQGDLVVLEPMSTDSSFQVQIYDKNTPIKIIGKYIGKFEMKN